MSRENVELVRTIHAAYGAGDYEAVFSLLDEDIEWAEPTDSAGASTYHGHDGVRACTVSWVGTFGATFRYEPEEFTDLGEHVLVRARQSGKGRTSGVEVSMETFNVWTVRDGKVTRMRMFRQRSDALEAAGVPATAE
jgi:ketosteroid isomerase-like protein